MKWRHMLGTVRWSACATALACCTNLSLGAPQTYVPQVSTCDGFPRAGIDMAAGLCAGLVTAPAAGAFHSRRLKTPRMLLQLQDPNHWLVTDLGEWTAGRGKVWLMDVQRPGTVRLTVLVGGLTLPALLLRSWAAYRAIGCTSVVIRCRISFFPAVAICW
jgi:hypothetical protein